MAGERPYCVGRPPSGDASFEGEPAGHSPPPAQFLRNGCRRLSFLGGLAGGRGGGIGSGLAVRERAGGCGGCWRAERLTAETTDCAVGSGQWAEPPQYLPALSWGVLGGQGGRRRGPPGADCPTSGGQPIPVADGVYGGRWPPWSSAGTAIGGSTESQKRVPPSRPSVPD